jgi:hypothetical protein
LALPETDFEYLLYGKPNFVFQRLASLGFLSNKGLTEKERFEQCVAEAQSRHDPNRTGPSYVHQLADQLISSTMISDAGVILHSRGPRSHLERWEDEEFMRLIGEEERFAKDKALKKPIVRKDRPWWKIWM